MFWGDARGWHSWNFRFYEDGVPVAATTLFSSWEAGELFLGESRFRIYREQVTSGSFVLEGEGARIATAGTLYAQPGSIGIECEGNSFELRADSILQFVHYCVAEVKYDRIKHCEWQVLKLERCRDRQGCRVHYKFRRRASGNLAVPK